MFPRNHIVVSTNSISICSPDLMPKINRFYVLGFVMQTPLYFLHTHTLFLFSMFAIIVILLYLNLFFLNSLLVCFLSIAWDDN